MEYADIGETSRKWIGIMSRNIVHIFFLNMCVIICIQVMRDVFSYEKFALLFIIMFNCAIFFPIIILKFKFLIRIMSYLNVLKKGKFYPARLRLIENANTYMGKSYLGGYTYRYIFHFSLFTENLKRDLKYTVICTKIDPNKLSLKQKGNQYVIQGDTVIPVMLYKKKTIVLQNDCGFFDLAHDNSKIKPIQMFW